MAWLGVCLLIRKRFAVRFFFFFFGRPKKNVKSVVISVLVTRRCSFGLQMKEVQSFTRCVFFFLARVKRKERWGEGDKMLTFFIVSQLWRSNIHQQLVFFSLLPFGQRARLARLARLSRNDLQVSRL